MLDTNAFDALSSTDALLVLVERLCAAGTVRFETTQVQERELARLREVDRVRHRRGDRVPRFVVPAVAGPVTGGRDGRIAATALRDGRTLVTDDAALREHAGEIGLGAWDTAQLLDHLARLGTDA